jgi:hypothetical protein
MRVKYFIDKISIAITDTHHIIVIKAHIKNISIL